MSVIKAVLSDNDFFKYLFDDFIGFAVLCVACVLMLSYLRERPPEFEKKRIFCAGSVLFVGAFFTRSIAHYAHIVIDAPSKYKTIFISTSNTSPKGDILAIIADQKVSNDNLFRSAIINLVSGTGFRGLGDYQKYILIINILTTVIGFVSICAGAFILMRIFRAKHITPMAVVQISGFLIKEATRGPFENLISLIFKKSDVKLCGYNGFGYGCFMILMIISYIIITKYQYENFWTKDINVLKHILSFVILIVAYVFLIIIYSSIYKSFENKNNSLIQNAFEIMIYIFLAAVFLYVPKRTYSITRGELQDDFYEVKREEEVEQYSFSETQLKSERKYMHDLPGHFRALYTMAEKIGADDILQYVQELDKQLIESKGEFSTGNASLDDFLHDKLKKARQYNIDIVFNGVFPNEGIKKIDVTTIFHNLIENAIEACKQVSEKREIIITSKIHEDRVYVSFSNPFEHNIKKKQGKIETSKKNKDFHGYGLYSVESIVTKKEYDGTFSTKQEGNIFTAEVNMKFK